MKTLKFVPGDTNYRWDFSENSPFLKRNLTLFSEDRKVRAKSLNVKKRVYALYFSNEKETYLSRNQSSIQPEPVKRDKKYLKESSLTGSTVQIRFSIVSLLNKVIDRFQLNPQSLFTEAARIKSICLDEGYSIPFIEAFQHIEDWNEFIQLLESLRANQTKFTFELLIAAIVQFAALCGG
ncbi:MAG: hypothetical protein MJE63_10545 [Proteobacteria bacterium]|nr:hypothetical protein [Pseudomonadota bacterium]